MAVETNNPAVRNNTYVGFFFNLANFKKMLADGTLVPVDQSYFADAGPAQLWLVDSAKVRNGPYGATLDVSGLHQFTATVLVYDPYTGLYDPILRPNGWVKNGVGVFNKTWQFEFRAPKLNTTAFYSSGLWPFDVAANFDDWT